MVEWKKLGECLDYEQPTPYLVKSTEYDDSYNTPVLTAGQSLLLGYTNETEGIYKASEECPTIMSNSMSFGRPYILKTDGCIHDGWIAMSDFDNYVTTGYFYEVLSAPFVHNYWGMKANNGGAMTNLNSDIVKETLIPIPSKEEQSRIVGILDQFEAIIDNLEAQLKAREKQYEYYRNKLLTFD